MSDCVKPGSLFSMNDRTFAVATFGSCMSKPRNSIRPLPDSLMRKNSAVPCVASPSETKVRLPDGGFQRLQVVKPVTGPVRRERDGVGLEPIELFGLQGQWGVHVGLAVDLHSQCVEPGGAVAGVEATEVDVRCCLVDEDFNRVPPPGRRPAHSPRSSWAS